MARALVRGLFGRTETIEGLQAAIDEYTGRRTKIEAEMAEVERRKGTLALAAAEGDDKAAAELDRATVEAQDLAVQIEHLDMAVREAESRLATKRAEAAQAERDRQRAELRALVKRARKLDAEIEDQLRGLATALHEKARVMPEIQVLHGALLPPQDPEAPRRTPWPPYLVGNELSERLSYAAAKLGLFEFLFNPGTPPRGWPDYAEGERAALDRRLAQIDDDGGQEAA